MARRQSPMEQYSTGEVQLIYDLVQEFPKEILLSTERVGDQLKITLQCRRTEMADFVEYLIKKLRKERKQLEKCFSLEEPVESGDV